MKKEFRAWNGQKFLYSNMGEFKYLGDFFFHTDNLGFSNPPTVYHQWTGLADCNGRKIFEGDFVKWDDASNGKYWRFAKVVWNEKGGWAFRKIPSKCIGENCQYEHDFNLTSFIYSPDTSKYGNVLEVVGNIFENPELLN